MRVVTAGASAFAGSTGTGPLILLPEASRVAGGEPSPDLATALRRHRGTRAITILGNGLGPRDIDATRGLTITFSGEAKIAGLTDLVLPPPVLPGAAFKVAGMVQGLSRAKAELLDPAGRVTDAGKIDGRGHFLLFGTARAAGTGLFRLRISDNGRVFDTVDVPLWVKEAPKTRLLILAGAPGPEVKYLRRWADDAGFEVTTQMRAGGGVSLGDAPVPLDVAGLARFDVAIVDDRIWAERRDALLNATSNGMGLILHAAGPVDPGTLAQWRNLGFTLKGTNALAPIALPKMPPVALAKTRQGIGSADRPADIVSPDDPLPDISRVDLTPDGPRIVPIVRDGGNRALAGWRAYGRGRIAMFTAIDSYALTLTGLRHIYGDWWGALLSAVARPTDSEQVDTAMHWVGERAVLCDLTGPTALTAPNGRKIDLLPVDGCGVFWPEQAGWYKAGTGNRLRAIYVQPAQALKSMRAMRDRRATMLLPPTASGSFAARGDAAPGQSWPWWLGWLISSAALWWLERSRWKRHQDARSAM